MHKRSIIEEHPDNLMKLLNANNYTKGGFVLHMLKSIIGDQIFWKGVSQFCSVNGGKNILTKDFQSAMENSYGESLEWFFKQWIYNPGIPYLDIEYFWDDKNGQININVKQIQETAVMRFPLEFEFGLSKNQKQTIWIEKVDQALSFQLQNEPVEVIADPGIKLLAKINLVKKE